MATQFAHDLRRPRARSTTEARVPEWVTTLDARLAGGALELPVLPTVALAVNAACAEDADLRALATIIRRDPAMAAHILRIANSPLFRGTVPIVSLQQAVARLGANRLREVALVAVCQAGVFVASHLTERVAEDFRHSLLVALIAQRIARMKRLNVEEAFLAGLLHDVGRPVLCQAIVDIAAKSGEMIEDGIQVEAVLSRRHAQVGYAVAKAWNLPASVCDTIARHHAPPTNELDAVVALGDVLAHEFEHVPESPPGHPAGPSHSLPGSWSPVAPPLTLRQHVAVGLLELYPDDLETLMRDRDAILGTVEALT